MSPAAATKKPPAPPLITPGDPFYRHLFASLRCGIITIDRQGRITGVNDLARRILELDQGDPTGLSCSDALKDYPQLAETFVESFGMKNQPNRAEMEIRLKDQRKRSIGFSLALIRDEQNEVLGAALIFRDLTLIEHHEEQEKLKERLAALGQMAAGMAHEIRNPLGGIEVTVSLLRRRLADRVEDVVLLDKILAEVKRLNRTVAESLEYVKPLHLDLKLASLESIVREALRRVAPAQEGKQIEIRVQLASDLPPVWMDPERIRDAVVNLVQNAFEAIPETGVVRVETGRESLPYPLRPPGDEDEGPGGSIDSHAVIRISDTGKGIPDEVRDRLFYPFFTTKQSGSGVGLPLAKKIVEGHRGIIDFESEVGKGTTFLIKLPLLAPPIAGCASVPSQERTNR